MFPEKFTFENKEVRTNKIEKTFLLLCNGSNGIERIKKRDVSLNEKRFIIKHDQHFNKLANEIWLNKLNKYLIRLKP